SQTLNLYDPIAKLSILSTPPFMLLDYSFPEPISTPFTKNLCKNRYILNSGTAETIITAYLTSAAALTCSEQDCAAPAIDDALSALTSLRIKICLNISCNGNKSSSLK